MTRRRDTLAKLAAAAGRGRRIVLSAACLDAPLLTAQYRLVPAGATVSTWAPGIGVGNFVPNLEQSRGATASTWAASVEISTVGDDGEAV